MMVSFLGFGTEPYGLPAPLVSAPRPRWCP